ncbi:hypothetical protein UlMin_016593 [Ulmus minor]
MDPVDVTAKLNKFHFLRRTLQVVLSVSIFSLIHCYSSGISFFPHSFNVYFSTFLFSIFTHTLETKYMFLICNGILAFLAKSSLSTRGYDSSSFEMEEVVAAEEVDVKRIGSDPVSDEEEEEEEESVVVVEEASQEHEEQDKYYEEQIEAGNLTEEVENKDDKAEEMATSDEELVSTEELNRKIEEFIRKMKEEIRIEAQQQLITV